LAFAQAKSFLNKNKESKTAFLPITFKLKNVFLIKNLKDLISWGSDECKFSITIDDKYQYMFHQGKGRSKTEDLGADFGSFKEIKLSKSPVYISPAGFYMTYLY